MRVEDAFEPGAFVDVLHQADKNAKPGFERNFVDSLIENYNEYCDSMFLSEKQESIIVRIARCA
jgi:hypothetical protein